MTVLFRVFIRLGCLLWVLASANSVLAQQRTPLFILTSFPDSVYGPFKTAFENANPDIELFIINRKTSAAISYVQDGFNRQVDLLWASAPDAFEVLKQLGKLQKLPNVKLPYRHDLLGYPLNDPDGYYAGFAISGYGIMWNEKYLRDHQIQQPESWNDLRRAEYQNHLGISAPSRSGTTHLIVEIILQSKGWREGWKALLEIGGNLATVTARSYGVPSGIEQGHFGAGLVIDFFGLRSKAKGHGVQFHYPPSTMMLPANVAMVRGAKNPVVARRFIAFLLSKKGQHILFHPAISRLPVDPQAYDKAPQGFPNPFKLARDEQRPIFDIAASRTRYHLVNALFDQLITFRLHELKEAWSLVHKAEAELQRFPDEQMSLEVGRARAQIEKIPVDADLAGDSGFAELFTRHKPGFTVSDKQVEHETKWRLDALKRYDQAAQIAEKILSVMQARKKADRQP